MSKRRHWPWWTRREALSYFATLLVLAMVIMGTGYLLMGRLVAWRIGALHVGQLE